MTKAEAERRSYAIHNAKCYLIATRNWNDKMENAEDPDCKKLAHDLKQAISLLTSIEYDLNKVPEIIDSKINRKK